MQLYIYIYLHFYFNATVNLRSTYQESFHNVILHLLPFFPFFFPDINETDSYSPYAVHFIRTGDLDCGILSPGNVETYLGNETINTTYKLQ